MSLQGEGPHPPTRKRPSREPDCASILLIRRQASRHVGDTCLLLQPPGLWCLLWQQPPWTDATLDRRPLPPPPGPGPIPRKPHLGGLPWQESAPGPAALGAGRVGKGRQGSRRLGGDHARTLLRSHHEDSGGGVSPVSEPGACPPHPGAPRGTAFQGVQRASLASLTPARHPAADSPRDLGSALKPLGSRALTCNVGTSTPRTVLISSPVCSVAFSEHLGTEPWGGEARRGFLELTGPAVSSTL